MSARLLSSRCFHALQPLRWSSVERRNYPFFQQRRSLDILIDPRVMSIRKRNDKKKKNNNKSAKPSYRFVDRTRVRVAGGRGGKGNLSMAAVDGRGHKLRPDGGHGGNGGSVILVADPNQQSLKWSVPHMLAQSGANGGSADKTGRDGKNLILRVPCGVVVKRVLDSDEVWDEEKKTVRKVDGITSGAKDKWQLVTHDFDSDDESGQDHSDDEESEDDDGEQDEDADEENLVFPAVNYYDDDTLDSETRSRESVVLADLDAPGAHIMVARGGHGGYGSCYYASEHGKLDTMVVVENAKPTLGEVAFLELELKMIADIGLVGFPNAGKSSLLRAMSLAAPEVAPYPFTTLHPILGCIDYSDGYRVKVADIPGLIEGASEGRGRGHDFLRHVERTKALLYIVDAAGVDNRDPLEDLTILADELDSYGDGSLLQRRALVVANKVDLLAEDRIAQVIHDIQEVSRDIGIQLQHDVVGISAGVTGQGLVTLSEAIRLIVDSKGQENRTEQARITEKVL